MLRPRLRWLVTLLAASALIGGKPVASPSNKQVTKPSKVVIRQNRLAESLKTWNRLKAKHGDHYRYEIHGGFYLGWGSITTIIVQDGKVVARTYEEGQTDNEGELMVEEQYSWTEKGAGVGSHEGSGAAPRTVDELYKECRDDVLTRNPRTNDIYLDVGNDGVLINCLYAPEGYAVDAAPGVSINALEFLPTKND